MGRPSKYKPDFHPDDIVAYFREPFDAIEEPERVESAQGRVKYVQAPVRPPLFAGYAARAGVRRQTLWNWARRHEEFDEAVGICKAMQEHVFITMGLLGAYRPGMTIFVLKNLLRWQDKVERANRGRVSGWSGRTSKTGPREPQPTGSSSHIASPGPRFVGIPPFERLDSRARLS